jgi:DNA (cytosine-5)-methyltransferase 1
MNKAVRPEGFSSTNAEIAESSVGDLSPLKTAPRKLKVISLFAGIGGFDRAFDVADGEIVMQCELDKFCQSVLKKHWPRSKLASDIKTLRPEDMPDADVWTAGFPCQDVSLARGNHGRNGLKGNHTSLFFELMRLVEVRRPKVLLLENVVGLLNSHQGCDFGVILTELIERGYAVSWRVMNARYFGVAQSRPRVFICAWKGDYHSATEALFEPKRSADRGSERLGFVTQSKHSTGAIVPQLAYCVAATSGRHTGNDWSRSYISYPDAVRRPTPTESERLQGFPAGWTAPPTSVPEPARGFDSERYKSVGNAVAVPVVTWIAKRIGATISAAVSRPDFIDLPEDVLKLAPELRNSTRILSFAAISEAIRAGTFVRKWKTGGVACRDMIIEGTASPAPSKIVSARFVDALDSTRPDDNYFLTANAAAGILRRVEVVGRTLFEPMSAALEKLVQSSRESPITESSGSGGKKVVKSSIRQTRTVERSGLRTDRCLSGGIEIRAD